MLSRIKYTFSLLLLLQLAALKTGAQCSGTYGSQAQLNWDNNDVFFNGAPYTSYITDGQEQVQRYAFGTTMMTMSLTNNALLTSSETSAHTGDLAGYDGEDVVFNPSSNGLTITLTFATPVLNVSFALYDIDASAVVTVAATDPSSGALTVTATPEATTILSIAGSPGQTITASGSTVNNSSNSGTATITVAGSEANPVKTITITITNRGSDVALYLSDITACVSGSFPTSWHQGFNNQPFTGNVENQPDYFLITPDNNSCYMMDPATGRCWWIFTDATRTYMNSFAYDPENRILYYITENPSLNSSNQALKKYDFNTETSSVVIANIETTLGIPTFNAGVESAAGAFYNGKLYLGIEGGQSASTIRESVVWEVDLTTNTAAKVHATNCYNGSGIIHDWADLLVKDGVLISYNSARIGSNYSNSSFTHFDLMTGSQTKYMNPSPGQKYSGQAGMSWNGNLYMIYDSVWLYNNGVISSPQDATVVTVPGDPAPPAWAGNAGDGSDPFRPKADFGDAPATYDPNANAPAVHERSEAIRLGTAWNREWNKLGVTSTEDVDEALAYVPYLASGTAEYVVEATVYNNNGSDATLIAWLDYNGNGLFDASEAIPAITVPSSASNQTFYLYWSNASNSFINGAVTYLRIRITSGAMTANDATGYFSNGEVEDYRVLVDDYPLTTVGLNFSANLFNEHKANLQWSLQENGTVTGYEIQKSKDSRKWDHLGLKSSDGQGGMRSYEFIDENVTYGTTYYRLRFIGTNKYSEIRSVHRIRLTDVIVVKPNPAREKARITVESLTRAEAEIVLFTSEGREVYRRKETVSAGVSELELPISPDWPNGTYIINIYLNHEMASRKLLIYK